MNTIVFPNDVFFEEVAERIANGDDVYIRPKGFSMTPFIRNEQDKVGLTKPNDNSFQKGNIILVKLSDTRFVMHRIENVSGEIVTLRGDGNVYGREICYRKNAIAEVIEVVRNGKSIPKGSFLWKCYYRFWPKNSFLRRIILGIDRRIPRKASKLENNKD